MKPVLGEDPVVQGFYHGCGFNSAGMMLGAGCGQELANWILDGRPAFDLYGYDIRRYCPQVSKDKQWVKERSHEAYAKNYSMVFPHDEPLAGRNMKKVQASTVSLGKVRLKLENVCLRKVRLS